ncbi:hypothetical protein BCR41DRAFT_354762 [Lobosporangium transversale]|uniref:FAD-binding PCMH-type domain-containing protein n=1 Tax=Lobosporangium transversale TaxID=64571 RepID=A0A1Y2GLE6_9FUNG|nr:hypothetical protein BCR41DRAFT_354762 [Lobosporangium transversale]ORZ14370.1 hypothetical protein BCR41DRAFT_354762 [Lobosporangium transversale]|eukprot:XP_021880848.1 hypothetical protein BCR41DRAFT_354762 [Lobosporangium transversale]
MIMHTLGSATLLLAISSMALAAAPTAPSGSSQQLAKCLKSLGSKVITSANSGAYEKERYAFDLRYTFEPEVIVKASSAADVQLAVRCAKDANVAVAPRSGGHSFEGYSIGGQDGSLVIDLAGLGTVKVTGSKAKVGAGVRLGKLYLELFKQGGWTINAGTCPSVGIGGHALGGGFGLLSRKYGLLIDRIEEMEVVNADGELLKVSATSHPDLFYALRGAGGGSFGVVTSFTIKPVKPASKVTSFTYEWNLSDNDDVLKAYLEFQKGSRDVGVEMNVAPDGLMMYGIFQGTKSQAAAAMKSFFNAAPKPRGSDVREERHIDAQLRFAFISGPDPKNIEGLALRPPYYPGDSRYTKGKSLVYPTMLKASTIALFGKWGAIKPKGMTANYLIIDLWGGAVKDTSASATSFIHRDAYTVVEFVAEWDANPKAKPGKPDCKPCLKWMDDMYEELLADYKENYSETVRGYQNYIDLDIPNWLEAYYGSAVPRLKQIKSTYDPSNVFRFPQSIPLE